jgi:hypothetical protein
MIAVGQPTKGAGLMATIAETRRDTWAIDRYAPLSGVLAVIGWIVGIVLIDEVESKDTGAELLASYRGEEGRILLAGIIWMIGTAFFVWFLGSLRSRLLAAEGGDGRLTSIAFAGGVGTAICLALLPGPDMAAAFSSDELDESAALALGNIGDTFFLGAEYLLPLLLVASALIALRYGGLPRWLAWIQVLMAIVLLTGILGWAALLFAFPIWVLVVSYLLWRPGTVRLTAP